jgi:hypothetical protein
MPSGCAIILPNTNCCIRSNLKMENKHMYIRVGVQKMCLCVSVCVCVCLYMFVCLRAGDPGHVPSSE